MNHRPRASLVLLASIALTASSLVAQQEILSEQQSAAGPLTSWLDGDHAFGDMGTMRSTLEEKGVEFFGGYSAEVWGNTTGGLERGSVYTGLLDFGVNLDFEKLAGWQGASFNTTWLWLSGRDVSEDKVGNFLTVSNIAGFNTLRMFEMWFQQDFFLRGGGDSLSGLSIRIGQLSADTEFIISDYGATFLNGTFGWPAFAYTNIPGGGPGYPMGAPAVRVAVTPVEWFTFQTAVYEGNVFPQDVNRSGFHWRLNRTLGYFWINEAQFRWNHSDSATGLPGQLKLGAWFHSADFAAAYGDDVYWGDSGYYAVIDQQLYREPNRAEAAAAPDGKSTKSFKEPVPVEPSNQGLGGFTRISFDPQDRNFVGFYFETGLVYTGLISGRDNDAIGIALGYADLTNGAAQTMFDEGAREAGYEMVIEATYDAEITRWLHVQPDIQYIVRPGGSGDLGNALVLGGRVSVTF
jgi:porin